MNQAQKEKLAKRWDYKPEIDDNEGGKKGKSSAAAGAGHHAPSSPFADDARPDIPDSSSTSSRREDLEEVRGLLNRNPTQGRRKAAHAQPQNPPNTGYQPPR
jgi:hypothetical protein